MNYSSAVMVYTARKAIPRYLYGYTTWGLNTM